MNIRSKKGKELRKVLSTVAHDNIPHMRAEEKTPGPFGYLYDNNKKKNVKKEKIHWNGMRQGIQIALRDIALEAGLITRGKWYR
jgi:hypothetical protein